MTSLKRVAIGLAVAALPCVFGCGNDAKTSASANPWQGHTYLLQIPGSHWTQPQQIGSEIGSFVPTFLLQVNSNSTGSLDVTLATEASGAQDPCSPTTTVSVASESPQFVLGPVDAPLHIADATHGNSVIATARSLMMTNVLPQDGATAAEGEFSAVIDAREMYPLFYQLMTRTADTVCAALASANTTCMACPQDGAPYCLTLKATQLAASLADDIVIAPIDINAVNSPSCSYESDAG